MIIQKKYKVSSKHSELEVTYTAGVLTDIKVFYADNEADFLNILKTLYNHNLNTSEFTIKEIKVNSQKQKIALWCQLYKMRYANDYKVTVREAGMLKNINLTQELISRFFDSKEWWAKEKTIARITSNYNELKRISNNKQQHTSKSNSGTQANANSLADEFRNRYK